MSHCATAVTHAAEKRKIRQRGARLNLSADKRLLVIAQRASSWADLGTFRLQHALRPGGSYSRFSASDPSCRNLRRTDCMQDGHFNLDAKGIDETCIGRL